MLSRAECGASVARRCSSACAFARRWSKCRGAQRPRRRWKLRSCASSLAPSNWVKILRERKAEEVRAEEACLQENSAIIAIKRLFRAKELSSYIYINNIFSHSENKTFPAMFVWQLVRCFDVSNILYALWSLKISHVKLQFYLWARRICIVEEDLYRLLAVCNTRHDRFGTGGRTRQDDLYRRARTLASNLNLNRAIQSTTYVQTLLALRITNWLFIS